MVTVVGSGVASDVTGAASVVAAVVSNSPFPDGPEKGASGVSCASHSKPPTVFLQTKSIPSISGQAVSSGSSPGNGKGIVKGFYKHG